MTIIKFRLDKYSQIFDGCARIRLMVRIRTKVIEFFIYLLLTKQYNRELQSAQAQRRKNKEYYNTKTNNNKTGNIRIT